MGYGHIHQVILVLQNSFYVILNEYYTQYVQNMIFSKPGKTVSTNKPMEYGRTTCRIKFWRVKMYSVIYRVFSNTWFRDAQTWNSVVQMNSRNTDRKRFGNEAVRSHIIPFLLEFVLYTYYVWILIFAQNYVSIEDWEYKSIHQVILAHWNLYQSE